MITNIIILNGPNLNLLGKREVAIYGNQSFDDYLIKLRSEFPQLSIVYHQSNHEGVLIDLMHKYGFEPNTGIVLNAGAYTHTSIALRDAVSGIENAVVEVHISDIQAREPFRKHSFLTEVCSAHVIGKGLPGYARAINFLLSD